MNSTLRLASLTALVICFSLLVCHATVSAQTTEVDVVVLKKGTVITGKILELSPEGMLKIRSTDGEVYVLEMTSVQQTYKRESGASVNTASDAPVSDPQGRDLSTDDASSAGRQEFERRKLSIEVNELSVGTSLSPSSAVASSWKRWQAFEGFTEIDESEFFMKAGYTAEASEARKYHALNSTLIWTGLVSAAIGTVALLIDANEKRADDTYMVIGGALASLGAIGLTVGLARSSHNWAPYATVQKIANDYNRALAAQLRVSF